MKIDKKQLYGDIEARFPDPHYSTEVNSLSSECMKVAQKWLDAENDHAQKSKRQLRKELKEYIMSNVDLRDTQRAYFVPSFIWIFIAGQVISFIVRYIVDKYTLGSGD